MSDIEQLVAQAVAEFSGIGDASALEQAKARYLGKSGSVTELLKGLGKLAPEERKSAGRPSTAPRSESRRRSTRGAKGFATSPWRRSSRPRRWISLYPVGGCLRVACIL